MYKYLHLILLCYLKCLAFANYSFFTKCDQSAGNYIPCFKGNNSRVSDMEKHTKCLYAKCNIGLFVSKAFYLTCTLKYEPSSTKIYHLYGPSVLLWDCFFLVEIRLISL